MAYQSISNLYADQKVLMFKDVFALEKIHGCLKAGSMIRLADGREVPVESIKRGDEVTVFDEVRREFSSSPVIDLVIQAPDPGLGWMEVRLENGRSLVCTVDHPFLTSNRGWVQAADLSVDDDVIAYD